ncbi:tRNA glutamyl-Q(34) synthetase GluQRS, partial [Desulfovibrio sp. OttesenSCG-928-F20]|nr:tRNA glutamyl-Q(34) synthetase GluQRS [Desulfovibrio sp. OttesenSCG-928-F20]
AHVPLLHDARGERLAKRHKALELGALRMAGVRPEAIVGWLAEEAGWRAQATAAHPAELLTNFSFESLRGRHLRLPDNIIDILLAF